MPRRVEIPLRFDQGLMEFEEESLLPPGFATELQNYVPRPPGGFRARRGWRNGSVLGGIPATRKVRGIGHYALASGYQTPQFVQKKDTDGSNTVTWNNATQAGNLLVDLVVTGGTLPAAPTGWSTAITKTQGGVSVAIYYKENAASETSHNYGENPNFIVVSLECEGLAISGALDKTASDGGTSSSPASGTTAVLAQADEMAIAVLGMQTTGSFSAQTNSYVERADLSSGRLGISAAAETKTVAATTATSVAATHTASNTWAGAIATFKAKYTASASESYLAAHDDGTNFDIWAIDAMSPGGATWALIDANRPATERNVPVAFAAGLGIVMYSHVKFTVVRKWNGSSASDVTAAPIGRALAFYRNMFFSGGSVLLPSRVAFSNIGDETTWTANDWVDVNEDDGEPIEDLLVTNDGLLIAKRNSLWFLSGAGRLSFRLDRIGGVAGGAPGRCLLLTPIGVIIAGKNRVWLWNGGEPEPISEPIENSYSISGNYVTTGISADVAYICDEGSGKTWVFDTRRKVWWTEVVDTEVERPATVFSHENILLYGPRAATTVSLLAYRDLTIGERERDEGLAETLKAHTGEMWVGEAQRPFTPMSLYLQVRQRGGDAADVGLEVTPVYEGEVQPTQTIKARAGGSQVFQVRLDVGYKQGLFRTQFRFEQALTTLDDALLEVEGATLVGLVGEPW